MNKKEVLKLGALRKLKALRECGYTDHDFVAIDVSPRGHYVSPQPPTHKLFCRKCAQVRML